MHAADGDDVDKARRAHRGAEGVVLVILRSVAGQNRLHERGNVLREALQRLRADRAGERLGEIEPRPADAPGHGVVPVQRCAQGDVFRAVIVRFEPVALPGALELQRQLHRVAGAQLAHPGGVVINEQLYPRQRRVRHAYDDAGKVLRNVGEFDHARRDRPPFARERLRRGEHEFAVAPEPAEAHRRGEQSDQKRTPQPLPSEQQCQRREHDRPARRWKQPARGEQIVRQHE